mmetsp:Transcript_51713/g.121415  ORF Transcript_51713/g.121415 Transcript_51713/m.121415 type:complete len:109 (-) Transcript_51713:119-445(-)|eukprot:CAMPEP_0177692774 /NCGR_PEP_ID=MMETSP0484_2-20121128/2036_1 /TAXON_ID=354590 /ORGANISM="Rhodomonas lens, Strain RHODO" /LENGTH=108 /DNA_ID=CAMNT_0019203521 /DNA_START=101 /DNA_END=427 /DNA_ORIENTATION=+
MSKYDRAAESYQKRDLPPAPSITLVTTSLTIKLETRSKMRRIKELLNAKGVKYEHIDLALEDRGDEIAAKTGRREVPQLLVNGRFIGTADDVQEFEDEGALDGMLGLM